MPFWNKMGEPRSLFQGLEERFFSRFSYTIPKRLQVYHLIFLSLIGSFFIIVFSYLAKFDVRWLMAVSLLILLHIVIDNISNVLEKREEFTVSSWKYYMEHIVDYVFLFSILIGYSYIIPYEDRFLMFFTMGTVSGYLLNSVLVHAVTGKVRESYFGIGPTEVRLMFVCVNVCLVLFGKVYFESLLPFLFLFSLVGFSVIVYNTQREIWESHTKELQIYIPRRLRTKAMVWLGIVGGLVIFVGAYSMVTNPFHPYTVYQSPVKTRVVDNEIVLKQERDVIVRTDLLTKGFAFVKSGFHIVASSVFKERPFEAETAEEIITHIHGKRFDPEVNPYVITGGHFNVLFIRNMGVFYHPLLDPYSALNSKDWVNRQRIAFQTAAYGALSLQGCGDVYTTMVTTGSYTVTCVNMHHYPSDSLYGILYTLKNLQSNEEMLARYYPQAESIPYELQTSLSARNFVAANNLGLADLVTQYVDTVYDRETGLVDKKLRMSSAKDASVRESAFYDNVIMWKTMELSTELGIKEYSQEERDDLKKRIIQTFWNDEGGFFYEDLSDESLEQGYYSSDWLAALFTGFLDPRNPDEQHFFTRSVAYIQREDIDEPFPIKYQQNDRNHRDVFIVQLVAPSYGGSSIWSFWGMEYIKLLIILHETTGNKDYLNQAQEHFDSYTTNIVQYGGFPEVYDSSGAIMDEMFYDSVLSTGWVVNYEQVGAMLKQLSLETQREKRTE